MPDPAQTAGHHSHWSTQLFQRTPVGCPSILPTDPCTAALTELSGISLPLPCTQLLTIELFAPHMRKMMGWGQGWAGIMHCLVLVGNCSWNDPANTPWEGNNSWWIRTAALSSLLFLTHGDFWHFQEYLLQCKKTPTNSNKILLIISVRQRPGAGAAWLGFVLGKSFQSGHWGDYGKPFQEKAPLCCAWIPVAVWEMPNPGCVWWAALRAAPDPLSPDPRSCSQNPNELPEQWDHPRQTCRGALHSLPSLLYPIPRSGDFPAPTRKSSSHCWKSPSSLWESSGIWGAAGSSLVPPNKSVPIVPLHCPPLSHNAVAFPT